MADTIADLVVKVSADMTDLDRQLGGLITTTSSLGTVISGTVQQISKIGGALTLPSGGAQQLAGYQSVLEAIPAAAQAAAQGTQAAAAAQQAYGAEAQRIIGIQADLKKHLEDSKTALEEIRQGYEHNSLSLETYKRAQESVADAQRKAGEDGEKTSTVFDKLSAGLSKITGVSGETAGEIVKVGSSLIGISLGAELVGSVLEKIVDFGKESMQAAAETERLGESLTILYGSSAQAAAAIEESDKAAAELGVSSEATRNLTHQMAVFGVKDWEEVSKAQLAAADAAVATGISFERGSHAMLLMAETGMASGRILRQLGLTTQDLASVMGVNLNRVQEAMRGLDFETRLEVEEAALKKFAGAGEAASHDTLAAWAKFKAEFSSLMDSVGAALNQVGAEIVDFGTSTVHELNWIGKEIGTLSGLFQGLATVGASSAQSIWDWARGVDAATAAAERAAAAQEKKAEADKQEAEERAKFQQQLREQGALYESERRQIEENTKAQLNQLQIADIEVASRRRMGEITEQQAIQQRLLNLGLREAAELGGIAQERAAVGTGPQRAQRLEELQRRENEIRQRFAKERAQLEADADQDISKIALEINKTQESEAERHATSMLEANRRYVEELRKSGAITGEEAARRQRELNRQEEQNAEADAETRRQLAIRNQMAPAVAAAQMQAEIAAARDRQAQADAQVDARLRDEQVANAKEAAQKMSAALETAQQDRLTQIRAGYEEEQRLQLITPEANIARLRQVADQEQQVRLNAAARNLLIARATGVDEVKAETDAITAIEAAYRQHADTMIQIDRQRLERMHELAEDEEKAEVAAWEGTTEVAKSALDARLQLMQSLAAEGHATAAERLATELETNEQIYQLELTLANNRKALLDDDAQKGKANAAERQQNANQIAMLEVKHAEDQLKIAQQMEAMPQRTLGIKDIQSLRTEVINSSRALNLLGTASEDASSQMGAAAGQTGATAAQNSRVMYEGYKKVLDNWIQLAIAQGGVAEATNEAGQVERHSLEELLVDQELVEQHLKYQQVLWSGFGPLFKDVMQVYDDMFSKFASGFAKAITDGKNFGKTLMGVLKEVENEILDKIIGFAFGKLAAAVGDVLVKHGGLMESVGRMMGGKTEEEKKAPTVQQAQENLRKAVEEAAKRSKEAAETHKAANEALEEEEKKLTTAIGDLEKGIADLGRQFQQALDRLAQAVKPPPAPPPVPTLTPVTPTPAPDRGAIIDMTAARPPQGPPSEFFRADALQKSLETLRTGEGGFGGGPLSYTARYRGPEPSHAEGAYQFEPATWAEEMRRLGAGTFPREPVPREAAKAEPGLQDLAAIELISRRGFQDWSMKNASLFGKTMPQAGAAQEQAQAFMASVQGLPLKEQAARAYDLVHGTQTATTSLGDLSETVKTGTPAVQNFLNAFKDYKAPTAAPPAPAPAPPTVTVAPPAPVTSPAVPLPAPVAAAPAPPVVTVAAPAPVITPAAPPAAPVTIPAAPAAAAVADTGSLTGAITQLLQPLTNLNTGVVQLAGEFGSLVATIQQTAGAAAPVPQVTVQPPAPAPYTPVPAYQQQTFTPVPSSMVSANRTMEDAALQQSTQNLRGFDAAIATSADRLNYLNTATGATGESLQTTNTALGTTKQQATDLGTASSVTTPKVQGLGDAADTASGDIIAGAARKGGTAGEGGTMAQLAQMASGLAAAASGMATGKGGPMAIMAGISSMLPSLTREIIHMMPRPSFGETPGSESMARARMGPKGEGMDINAIMTQQNTRALGELKTANYAAVGATAASTVAMIANMTGNKTLAYIMEGLTIALNLLTIIETIRAAASFFLGQHGGVVPGSRGAPMRAVIHGGELVANESMMRELGSGMATGTSEGVMRNIAGLTAGSTANASAAAARAIGEQLSGRGVAAGGAGTVSFDGAVFHGVPDQRYVNNIMDTAVRSLRNSSRTWAFNPTGQ